jgi:5-methyltetrahydrofolate corrinoid/iron sulfur protein methyltransferase
VSVLIVADNIHGLNPVIAEAMERLDPRPIRELARRCVADGADVLDINPGWLSRRNEDRMAFLVETVEDATEVPLVLDSPNPRILAVGLAACRKKPVLSALSLEDRKLAEILPLAVEHDTDLVVLLMDERSFPPAALEEKLALAVELREHAREAGVNGERLIFDPVLPNLTWDDAYFRIAEDVKTVRLLASGAMFGEPARTMAGLSNLRSGARSRFPFALEEACLALLAGAGLDYALTDVRVPGSAEARRLIRRLL